MRTVRDGARRSGRGGVRVTLIFALLLTALVAGIASPGDAGALARPGRPTAKTPSGTIDAAKPLFTWSKAARAGRYELRVYQAGSLVLKKSGIARLSWRSGAALAKNVSFAWKVRARNAAGFGPWSATRRFEVTLAIGDAYGGGTVAYILRSGDSGYVAGERHGLIAAVADQSAGVGMIWSNIQDTLVGASAQGLALGTGRTNTAAIVAQTLGNETIGYVHCTAGAAFVCDNLVEGGYDDWYLPSKDELNKLYLNQEAIGGFNPSGYYQSYWSSSECAGEYDLVLAWYQYFLMGDPDPAKNGYQTTDYKSNTRSVRAVRSF